MHRTDVCVHQPIARPNALLASPWRTVHADRRYPQFTEAKILSEFIKTDAYKMEVAVKPPMAVTNAVSWRTEGIKYKKNEVFLDAVESVNLLVNSNGTVGNAYLAWVWAHRPIRQEGEGPAADCLLCAVSVSRAEYTTVHVIRSASCSLSTARMPVSRSGPGLALLMLVTNLPTLCPLHTGGPVRGGGRAAHARLPVRDAGVQAGAERQGAV